MKGTFILITLLFFCICDLKSQEKSVSNIPMIGEDAKSTLMALQSTY